MKGVVVSALTLVFLASALAQIGGFQTPSVQMAPAARVQVKPGGTATVDLDFRIAEPFHINSNKPKSELLVPTTLQLTPPAQIGITEVKYPAGKDETFPFAPKEPLNVYSGDFSIEARVKALPNAAPGVYPVSGELKFQACDRSACYPPKSMPVNFQVTVVK